MSQPQDEVINDPAVDETELDKSLEASIASLKGAVPPEATPVESPEDPKDTPPKEPEGEPASPAQKEGEEPATETTPAEDPKPEETIEFKVPAKAKFESEESYQKRLEIAELIRQRKIARTAEDKEKLSATISNARGELSTIRSTVDNKIKNPNDGKDTVDPLAHLSPEDREAYVNDQKRLKELGGATKEEIKELINQDRHAQDVTRTLEDFVNRHPELKNDEDTREVFFDFVNSNYQWSNKTPKELMTVLELARENMFKPSETIQERVLKGAKVAEKVNSMQFPGGTIVRPALTSEQKSSVQELMATGMSEEKALELISE
ncbi:MAG: hypothetical protein V4509_00450 [Patescibacteria group bacterium]